MRLLEKEIKQIKGGRPEFAQGFVPNKDKLADAIAAFEKMIRKL